jgi:hypothetical protein
LGFVAEASISRAEVLLSATRQNERVITMVSLLSVKEVLRFDGPFVVSKLLPYWQRHGASGVLRLELDGATAWSAVMDLEAGNTTEAGVEAGLTLRVPQTAFAALCQGKAKADDVLDQATLHGSVRQWQLLAAACRPTQRAPSAARDVGSTGVAAVKPRDFKKLGDGPVIKGVVLAADGSVPTASTSDVAPALVEAPKVASDPAAFAASHLAALFTLALERARLDDDVLTWR